MDHNFEYRQSLRQERLYRRQQAARAKRIRIVSLVSVLMFLFISVISANAIIAKANQNSEKSYQKQYIMIDVEKGDTVWSIANEYMSPGYEDIMELVNEIGFINSLDDSYSVKSGNVLLIPYFAEI